MFSHAHILEPGLAMLHVQCCLPTLETPRNFAMLFLTLMATSRCLAFARGRAATSPNLAIIRSRRVGERGEN